MKKVAVFGSREGVDLSLVASEIDRLVKEHGTFIVVTTEAKGVCSTARDSAEQYGLPVIVFKPIRLQPYRDIDPQFSTQELRIHRGTTTTMNDDLSWADWQSACNWRSMLMVDRAEIGLAFQRNGSWGTQFEIDLFSMYKKPCRTIKS